MYTLIYTCQYVDISVFLHYYVSEPPGYTFHFGSTPPAPELRGDNIMCQSIRCYAMSYRPDMYICVPARWCSPRDNIDEPYL